MNLTNNLEETIARIHAMLDQEATGYRTADFIGQSSSTIDVDADCRSKMAQWCYSIVDFCSFERESVEIAMNYLDRYLLTETGSAALQDRTLFQLASMTTLYTAVKVHEAQAIDPESVSTLSRDCYTAQQIEEMESILLNALQWRMNPPTILSFIRQYLDLIPESVLSDKKRETVLSVARLQSELAVSDYNFIAVKPSAIAYCSLMNALDSIALDQKLLDYIAQGLTQVIGVDQRSNEIFNIQSSLYSAVEDCSDTFKSTDEQQPAQARESKRSTGRSSFETSPRSTAMQHLSSRTTSS